MSGRTVPRAATACLMRRLIPTDMDDDKMTRPGIGYGLHP